MKFRNDFVTNGPGEPGIDPNTAVERLKRFKDQYDIFARKRIIGGEELFAIKPTPYPELTKTKRLYVDVFDKIEVGGLTFNGQKFKRIWKL